MLPVVPPRQFIYPRAIIFDWDNTLIDSWGAIHDALNICMTAMGQALWTLDETKARARLSLRDSFPKHFGARWEEARDIYLGAFRDIHLDRLAALAGREAMLEALAGEGLYLGVVSNKTGAFLRREAEQIGWARHFGAVVGAGDAHADKPHSAPVLMALEPSGIAAGEDVWFVGDTAVDMVCALNTGCIPVLLGTETPAEEFAEAAPALAFEDTLALTQFLRDLRSDAGNPSS